MKLYNPYKPHIVTFANGKCGIRRRRNGMWQFLDRENRRWWTVMQYVREFCEMDALIAIHNMRDPYRADRLEEQAFKRKQDIGTPNTARDFSIFTLCGYILAYGLATASGILIAWPIIEWAFTGR